MILANAIYEIRAVNSENITTAFQDYYEERYPHAVEQLKFSKLFTMLMAGQVRKKIYSLMNLKALRTCHLSDHISEHHLISMSFFYFYPLHFLLFCTKLDMEGKSNAAVCLEPHVKILSTTKLCQNTQLPSPGFFSPKGPRPGDHTSPAAKALKTI